jgi:NAD(P)-dependent dehydrogenase (short-subunit alcohol dehydrogenase family)
MLLQGSGAIVNCSSIGGMVRSKGQAAYCTSKFAITGLTRAAALGSSATRRWRHGSPRAMTRKL